MTYYPLPKQKTLFYVSWVTGLLSLFGSCAICYMIISDRKRKLVKVYHRILLGMSICDVIQTFWHIMGALPVPRGTDGVYGALGNQASCTAQGFFLQFGLSVPCYSGSLALFYVFTTNSKSTNATTVELKMAKYYEPLMHGISLLYPLGTAVTGLVMKLYNPVESGTGCWIAEYPTNCGEDPTLECERGENALAYVWLFAGLEVLVLFVTIIICMIIIYVTVKRQEKNMLKRYDFSQQQSRSSINNNQSSSFLESSMNFLSRKSKNNNNNGTSSSNQFSTMDSQEMTLGTSSRDHARSTMLTTKNGGQPEQPQEGSTDATLVATAEDPSSQSQSQPPQDDNITKKKKRLSSGLFTRKESVKSKKKSNAKEIAKKRMDKTKLVANQAMWYIGTFFLTFIWSCILSVMGGMPNQEGNTTTNVYFFLDLMQEFFLPMQGFFTFLVYVKPRYASFRRDYPEYSRLWSLYSAVLSKETITSRNRTRRASFLTTSQNGCGYGGANNNSSSGQYGSGNGSRYDSYYAAPSGAEVQEMSFRSTSNNRLSGSVVSQDSSTNLNTATERNSSINNKSSLTTIMMNRSLRQELAGLVESDSDSDNHDATHNNNNSNHDGHTNNARTFINDTTPSESNTSRDLQGDGEESPTTINIHEYDDDDIPVEDMGQDRNDNITSDAKPNEGTSLSSPPSVPDNINEIQNNVV